MSRTLPPLTWLRAFEAAARHLSFTGAAAELNITQSAVSQQIKGLEGYLGQPLFHRRPRAIELTQTGLSYLPTVREAFHTLSRGTRMMLGPDRQVLQIQCNLTFAIHWLAPRIGGFQVRHPGIRINLRTELWEARDMAEGADLEIRYSLRPAENVHARLLRRDHYFPVTAPGRSVTLEALPDQPLWDCANLLCNWPSWAEDCGLDWPDPPVTYASTYSVALSVAASGFGVALAHDTIARGLIDQGRLIAPFHHRAPMREAYYLLTAPHAEDMPSAQAFTDWLLAELALFEAT